MNLIGICRLGNDAEVRYTPSGKAVANLSLAYNYGVKDDEGNRRTQWVDASLWGDKAERLQQYLVRGTLLHVVCKDVHIETYVGRNGPAVKLVGIISDIEFVPRQKNAVGQQQWQQQELQQESHQALETQSNAGAFSDIDDDIPF